jgi:hypothetical protein
LQEHNNNKMTSATDDFGRQSLNKMYNALKSELRPECELIMLKNEKQYMRVSRGGNSILVDINNDYGANERHELSEDGVSMTQFRSDLLAFHCFAIIMVSLESDIVGKEDRGARERNALNGCIDLLPTGKFAVYMCGDCLPKSTNDDFRYAERLVGNTIVDMIAALHIVRTLMDRASDLSNKLELIGTPEEQALVGKILRTSQYTIGDMVANRECMTRAVTAIGRILFELYPKSA